MTTYNSSDTKNIDIYSIPVYYISFGKNLNLEKHLSEQGFINVNHFEAIDGKKLKPDDLRLQRKITFRAYNDLIQNRGETWGIPSLGAIGCTSSHNELWKKCVNENMNHIIIVENDLVFKDKFSDDDIKFINYSLRKPKSAFFGSRRYKSNNNMKVLGGTQFCILSKDCCKELSNNVFPIEVQTDVYITHMENIGLIEFKCRFLTTQKLHISLIQDFCFKCILPNKNNFYYGWVLILIVLLYFIYYYIKAYRVCMENKI